VRTLRVMSIITVMCTASILLFVVISLLSSGAVGVSNSAEYMVVFPTVVGLPCAFAASIIGIAATVQRRTRAAASILLTLGQFTTVALGAAIIVWALNFGTTGWELVFLPAALLGGQILVAVGLCFRQRVAVDTTREL